jgi:hypothetical protein
MLTGGCHCGAIRYAASGPPFNATICHCSVCRRTTGAPLVAWFSVRPDGFRITRGQPRRHRTSASGERSFCADCGTQLTFRRDDLDEVEVTTCSLDDPASVAPADNTWTSSRVPWIVPDGRPGHPEARGS